MNETPVLWWCECDYPPDEEVEAHGGVLVHLTCGLPVPCDFNYHVNDPPHAASSMYITYMVCDEHEGVAERLYMEAD